MDIQTLAQHWEMFAETDPLGTVPNDEGNSNRNWHPEAFFRSGDQEITAALREIEHLGITLARARALDFGCGVGRLAQALAQRFERVDGVDISPTMVERARHYNRFRERCRYHANDSPDLALFEDEAFDFIVSEHVLQHVRPEYSGAYIEEFLRVLRSDGVAVFQMYASRPAPNPLQRVRESRRRPMPNDAFRAEIVPDRTEVTTRPASWLDIDVMVRNVSTSPWPDGQHLLRLGCRWLAQGGTRLDESEGRAPMPVALEPGGKTPVGIRVRAPGKPGEYLLELDMVQDFVAWFSEKGSATSRVKVKVETDANEPGGMQPPLLRPRREFHGVPRKTVETIVESRGGQILLVNDENASHPKWDSVRYYVKKAS